MRTFQPALTVAACLALTACAGRTPPPAIRAQVVEVKVPVAVACVDSARVPAMPARVGDQLTGDAVHDASVLARADLALRSALDQALALLGACTAPAAGN